MPGACAMHGLLVRSRRQPPRQRHSHLEQVFHCSLSSLAPLTQLSLMVSGARLVCLAAIGAVAARAGGATPWTGAGRVALWGALAMAATAEIGKLFGTVIS